MYFNCLLLNCSRSLTSGYSQTYRLIFIFRWGAFAVPLGGRRALQFLALCLGGYDVPPAHSHSSWGWFKCINKQKEYATHTTITKAQSNKSKPGSAEGKAVLLMGWIRGTNPEKSVCDFVPLPRLLHQRQTVGTLISPLLLRRPLLPPDLEWLLSLDPCWKRSNEAT